MNLVHLPYKTGHKCIMQHMQIYIQDKMYERMELQQAITRGRYGIMAPTKMGESRLHKTAQQCVLTTEG